MNMRRAAGISDDPEFISGFKGGHEVLVKPSDLLKSTVSFKADPVTGGIEIIDPVTADAYPLINLLTQSKSPFGGKENGPF